MWNILYIFYYPSLFLPDAQRDWVTRFVTLIFSCLWTPYSCDTDEQKSLAFCTNILSKLKTFTNNVCMPTRAQIFSEKNKEGSFPFNTVLDPPMFSFTTPNWTFPFCFPFFFPSSTIPVFLLLSFYFIPYFHSFFTFSLFLFLVHTHYTGSVFFVIITVNREISQFLLEI